MVGRHCRTVGVERVGLVVAVGVLGAITACSNGTPSANVDTSSIQAPIAAQLQKVGLTSTSIDCPPGQPTSSAPLACAVTLGDGTKVGLAVGVTDDGGQQRLTWKVGPDLVDTGPLVADLTTFARTAVSDDLDVTCPPAVVIPGGNGRLTCDVTDGSGQKGKIVVPLQGGQPVADHDTWSVDQS
jgi:hypothetical protein